MRLQLRLEIKFLGAFDKSGNYALRSGLTHEEVAEAVTEALSQDERLHDLDRSHVTVLPAAAVQTALGDLIRSVGTLHGNLFDPRSFGVRINASVWRAGLTFLPEEASVDAFTWPAETVSKVSILASSGRIIKFLKREESEDQKRISFGDPTRAVDAALEASLRRAVTSTSRSGRTIQGVLRLLS